ncbi:hypothetical protein RHODGE_RHODGE_03299 [Rhodoplanes serenus]|uniref:Uncharacterized protein n=1 Tax=Rhodoplanes serenus TaxID=200615 RepID=A0A3S4DGX0_9BRAD|nr:hypothetical protein [Rhodoplanes serenus]VCU10113.1 hypothetical protein RHODGE_RHODGE_03299 [Rhodoplanes serenus]
MIKRTRMRLTGVSKDGALMWPGVSVLTWVRAPGMPWVLVSIEPESP